MFFPDFIYQPSIRLSLSLSICVVEILPRFNLILETKVNWVRHWPCILYILYYYIHHLLFSMLYIENWNQQSISVDYDLDSFKPRAEPEKRLHRIQHFMLWRRKKNSNIRKKSIQFNCVYFIIHFVYTQPPDV